MAARVTTIAGMRPYATSAPFSAPSKAPAAHAANPTATSGMPVLATTPARTLHTAKAEPTEMSISPDSITRWAPAATTRTVTFTRNRSRRFSTEKYGGARIASAAGMGPIASATGPSRRLAEGHWHSLFGGGFVAREDPDNGARPHDRDAIRHREQLRQIG